MLNIVLSVVLVQPFGINGVLIGTFVTSLIYLFSRFYIISKYVYYVPFEYYIKKLLKYFSISIISVIIIQGSSYLVNDNTVWGFVLKSIVVSILAVVVPAALLSYSREFEYLVNKLLPRRIRCLTNNILLIGIVLIVIVCFIGFI